ncbi:MAG: glutamate-5-semialdehyde dehydrogenase [Oscillospiraceae bacterium]|nr:glutamate-5-semialdehyde dehydrogenase [Oscillospiraceae bacterium]
MTTVRELAQRCKKASAAFGNLRSGDKNKLLEALALVLLEKRGFIKTENQKDILLAKENGLTDAMIDRLRLTDARIDGMAGGIRKVIALPDPVGGQDGAYRHPEGMLIARQRVPLGVVGMIYESRPNVTVDSATLCLKSGNACLLRGGKEAIHSNIALSELIRKALKHCDLSEDLVCLVTDTNRQSAVDMMGLTGLLDVLIPRGGAGLINAVVENSRVPVIETGVGNCHVYVDNQADLRMATDITVNAKCSRPSVCNAAETLLVGSDIALKFLPLVQKGLEAYNVRLHGCPETISILGDSVIPATEDDWGKEYLDYDLAVRVVSGVDEAIEHIGKYTSGHSECIVTESYKNARTFCEGIDAAAVYVNASTRYSDGEEFGMGAEIGISTQKLHVRGPMGLEHLTTVKYIIQGNGEIR